MQIGLARVPNTRVIPSPNIWSTYQISVVHTSREGSTFERADEGGVTGFTPNVDTATEIMVAANWQYRTFKCFTDPDL